MREISTAIAVYAGLISISMGAGPADFRAGAIIMALTAATFAAVREAFR